jgi:hypothetical protein
MHACIEATSNRIALHAMIGTHQVAPALGLNTSELNALQRATQRGGQLLATALAAANRTCWNCIDGVEGPIGGGWGMNTRPPPADPASCADAMRELCRPARQRQGMFMSWDGTCMLLCCVVLCRVVMCLLPKPTEACLRGGAKRPISTHSLSCTTHVLSWLILPRMTGGWNHWN